MSAPVTDGMDAIRDTFFLECEEQLAALETGLQSLLDGAAPGTEADTIDAVFRAVHSIKGGAGAFSLDRLVRFAHAFESALDDLRAKRLAVSPDNIRVMLRAADHLADLVRAARDGSTLADAPDALLRAELAALRGAPPEATAPAAPAVEAGSDDMDGLDFQPVPVAVDPGVERRWQLHLRPHRELYERGSETANLLRELQRLGELAVTLDDGALPDLAELDPDASLLSWTATLRTARDEAAILDVFEFVDGECDLFLRDETAPPEAAGSGGEDLIAALLGRTTETPVPAAAPDRNAAPAAAAAVGELPDAVPAPARVAAEMATIRVGLDRVDRLVNLVGELVINAAMVSQRMTEAGVARDAAAATPFVELEGLTREIQDSVMAIRAQPVQAVFARMPRLLREVCALTGKTARLVMEGEATEVDRTVIEHLSEPLTHMLRNAVDHGLEDAEARRRSGKPTEGVIRLSASHRSGRIVIEMTDDGAGIDRERVRERAIARGLLAADATPTDEEIDNLIFLPGFSTAATVSDLSGRGVGMDVVRRSVQALGGRIGISSRPGLGSTFTLSLPLTLAVLDGMVIVVAGQTLIVPLAAIVETLRPGAADLHPLGVSARMAAMRGRFVPLLDLGEILGIRAPLADPEHGVAVLVENENGERSLLLADEIRGQKQVVIKGLEANYRAVPGISAATVMGNGRVALILDVDAIIDGRKHAVPVRAAAPPAPLATTLPVPGA